MSPRPRRLILHDISEAMEVLSEIQRLVGGWEEMKRMVERRISELRAELAQLADREARN